MRAGKFVQRFDGEPYVVPIDREHQALSRTRARAAMSETPDIECEACAKARLNPYSGLTFANCLGCSVRAVSSWSNAQRQEFYAGIADRESREEFVDAVNVEYARRMKLLAKLAEPSTRNR